jgi:penicillin-binding protein 2
MIKELFMQIKTPVARFFSHRIFWMCVVALVLFYIMLARLFALQIAEAYTYTGGTPAAPRTETLTRPVAAHRGHIYDRHGRPLAVNILQHVVVMDPSVPITNDALLQLAILLEDTEYVDSFPITQEREFTIEQAAWRERWLADMAVPREATAAEAWDFLLVQWGICDEMDDADARRIMNLRAKIFYQRLHSWDLYMPTPIIIAYDVCAYIIAAVTELSHIFTGVGVDIATMRYYPAGRYVSHMVGYIGLISAAQLERNEHLGYTAACLFGRAGLELSMEHSLRGQPGLESFDVDSRGRRITTPVWDVQPRPGHNIFLTIDLELQREAFHILEGYLVEALLHRMNLPATHDFHLSLPAALAGLVRGYNLDIAAVVAADESSHAWAMRQFIAARPPIAADTTARAAISWYNGVIAERILAGGISPAMVLLTMIGTGQIPDEYGDVAETLIATPAAAREVFEAALHARIITPQMLGADPSTGSLIVTCTMTGEVLAAVSYPAYDNNRLVGVMDADYFRHINSLCPTHPMTNRPFMEGRAPGSTFKMFTAVAALENGAIAPGTRIHDRVRHYNPTGAFMVACWHSGGHGSIDVRQAIAVSCNYFFSEAAIRLGHAGRMETAQGIATLNRYMEFFGLDEPTGVQVGELAWQMRQLFDLQHTMASPALKHHLESMAHQFPDPTILEWYDGDTAQTAIGQGNNSYTAAQMVRGMATIANRGVNLELTLVARIADYQGNIIYRHTPVARETDITVSDSTWDAVIEGMRLVVEPGAGGTGVGVFRNFQHSVAGKTGTAQQVFTRLSHTAFGAFAPIDSPQIAVYAMVPFGSVPGFSQSSAMMSRDVIALVLDSREPLRAPAPNSFTN